MEAAGLSTVLVTNMPYWAQKTGVPRTLTVEFPFGHTLGWPHDIDQQMRVIRQALEVLELVEQPGAIVHSPEVWPMPQKEALKDWQPDEASPVIQYLAPRFREIMREGRRKKKKL